MRRNPLLSASRALLLFGLALLLLGCDSGETTRQVILTRPTDGIVFAPTATATLPPATDTPVPRPQATPTTAAEIREYDAVVQYWNSSIALTNPINDAYNNYVAKTLPYDTFDEYKQYKDSIVPASDQLATVIDRNVAALQALNPPPRAAAYHNAIVQYWQEQRAYVSDLRQGIDRDNADLWNQGIARQPKLKTLSDASAAEKQKLYNNYIALGRAK